MPDENLLSRITVDPEIWHGKPCVRGLRYPVEAILEYLAGGDSVEDLLAEFPDLERDDILARQRRAGISARGKRSATPGLPV